MTELHERTARKYRGEMARKYEKKRRKQARWHIENKTVERMLRGLPRGSTVLDVPVGTGRFIDLYREMGLRGWGIDVSEEMLAQAKRRLDGNKFALARRSIFDGELPRADVAVCVRFLDLIDEPSMRRALTLLLGSAKRHVILTIRLGDEYVLKSNTATHDEKKFKSLVGRAGWQIEESVPVFRQGWHIIRLRRR